MPTCCHACESRTIAAHCASPACPWKRCLKCMAISAFVHGKRAVIPGYKRFD